jgi:DNA-binding CsgD family transcriptional regulator
MRTGRLDDALTYLEKCRDYMSTSGNTFGVGCCVFRLGWIAGARGQPERARELLQEALRLHWILRNRRVVALCLEQLACIDGGLREALDRVRLFAAAETMFEQLPDYTLPPQMVDAHQRGVDAARDALGDRSFAEAWSIGRSMSVGQAVDLALGTVASAKDEFEQSTLSAREIQILPLVAEGLTNRQIGLRLGLSHHTVDNHLRRLFDKVGVTSRTGLAMWSVNRGVVSSQT